MKSSAGLMPFKAPGEITVHCLEGRVACTALGQTHELAARHMLYLEAGEPHSVRRIEDAAFLLPILLHP